ncbi:MAG: hypothetical protein H7276_04160, partial [Caulobacter sp.]|nr:hypothetical protein [Vitreoscilla sp.]
CNDERDFADKVCWLLGRPDEMARRGALGRARAREIGWESSIPELLRAYAGGLGARPRVRSEAASEPIDRPSEG